MIYVEFLHKFISLNLNILLIVCNHSNVKPFLNIISKSMFKTYGEKLREIEKQYEDKDYDHVVVECAKLIEQSVGYLFRNFHRTLNTLEGRLTFLDFEKNNGDKYISFLKRPTIGVAIGFYNTLLNQFKDHEWLKEELKKALTTINIIRNAQVHAGKGDVKDHEAGEVIDSAEKFLKGTGLYDKPFEDVGFPLKYYLVFTSIQSKFKKGETETDFKKIIHDSTKLIPDLLNSVFNKVYPFLPISDKEKLNQLYPKTLSSESKEISLKYFVEIFDEIKLFEQIENGDSLKSSLEAISEELSETYSRRATRHHVNVLEIIFQFIHNKELDHFLDFADLVKKKYLEDSQINTTDRIILNDRAKELGISGSVAGTIENTVVQTIEKELILFQTLHEEKPIELKTGVGQKQESSPERYRLKLSKKMIFVIIAVFVIISSGIIYLLIPKSEYTSYERAYFEGKHNQVIRKSDKKRSLINIKANYYFINSTRSITNDDLIPDGIKKEYQDLLEQNPESPEAHLYLGYVYLTSFIKRYEWDSSWILINKALDMGLKDEYAELCKAEFLNNYGLSSLTLKTAQELAARCPDNLRILEFAADVYLNSAYDTTRATELYEMIKTKYTDYLDYYIHLSYFAMNRNDYETAGDLLSKAERINSKNKSLVANAWLFSYLGQLDKAEECLIKAIKSFGKNDIRLYSSLANTYLRQDKIKEGIDFLENALIKFPRNPTLLYYQDEFKNAQHWLSEDSTPGISVDRFKWVYDFNEAQTLAKKEGKPILAEFILRKSTSPWRRFHQYICADSIIIDDLEKFVLVSVNSITNTDLFDEYGIKFRRFDLLIISDDGTKVSNVADYSYVTPVQIHDALINGLDKYNRYVLWKSLNTEDYTEVSNFEDARIISKAKNYPIMVIVGSENSKYSSQLIDKTLNDPVFQSEFKNLVYLYLDQNKNKDFVKRWEVKAFPSILFFNGNGEKIDMLYGFKPPDILAKIISDIKESHYKKEKYIPDVDWLYSFEEAKTIAMVEKKNILVGRKEYMDTRSLVDDAVKNVLHDHYICLDINDLIYNEVIQMLGYYLMYSGTAIFDPAGNAMFQATYLANSREFENWLNIEDKIKILSLLGNERYENYQNNIMLAQELNDWGLYGSAIDVFSKTIDVFPDNPEIYLEIAFAYLNWFKPSEAIEYFQKALDHGAGVSENMVSSMINAYLQLMDKENLLNWFDQAIDKYQKNKSYLLQLNLGLVELYKILQDWDKAVASAEAAIRIDPDNYNAYRELGILHFLNNNFQEARKYLGIANQIDPRNSLSFFYSGLCAEKEGKYGLKEEYFKIALKNNPTLANDLGNFDYWDRPNFYKYPGYIAQIERGFIYAIMLDSTNSNYTNYLAYLYACEGYKLDKALDLVNSSLTMDPNDYATIDTKSWILYKLGKYEEAHEAFLKAQELTPEGEFDIIYLYHLGKIKLGLGDSTEAKKCLEEMLKIPEPNAEGMRYQEEVREILRDL
jgi:tetratricopeptide (TPR) repeat protein/thioredoxin-related protein